jgi:hypothetical protein
VSRRSPGRAGKGWNRLATALVVLAFAVAVADRWDDLPSLGDATTGGAPAALGEDGAAAIADAFRTGRSDLIVEASGIVRKVLRDDREGSRHQRIIVELADRRTLLIAHNIDLAPRVDSIRRGDAIRFRGEYEWNDKGGVLHWTHRDPAGRHPGGWIEHDGRRYE